MKSHIIEIKYGVAVDVRTVVAAYIGTGDDRLPIVRVQRTTPLRDIEVACCNAEQANTIYNKVLNAAIAVTPNRPMFYGETTQEDELLGALLRVYEHKLDPRDGAVIVRNILLR